jgi:hypothetical protein
MRVWLLGAAALCAIFAVVSSAQPKSGTGNSAGAALPSCPGDKVVWVNTQTGIYHFQGERWFGTTKSGKYMCERAADQEGDRPTHNGQ